MDRRQLSQSGSATPMHEQKRSHVWPPSQHIEAPCPEPQLQPHRQNTATWPSIHEDTHSYSHSHAPVVHSEWQRYPVSQPHGHTAAPPRSSVTHPHSHTATQPHRGPHNDLDSHTATQSHTHSHVATATQLHRQPRQRHATAQRHTQRRFTPAAHTTAHTAIQPRNQGGTQPLTQ